MIKNENKVYIVRFMLLAALFLDHQLFRLSKLIKCDKTCDILLGQYLYCRES